MFVTMLRELMFSKIMNTFKTDSNTFEGIPSALPDVSEGEVQAPTVSQPVQPAAKTSAKGIPFAEIIKKASAKYGVDEKVIAAVIKQESSFNPNAVSSCGAKGLMQLMPSTARGLGVSNVFDPEQNIMAGTKYLKLKLDEFGGNLSLALAAYNAGSGAVRKYGGVPPYKETQNYVAKITRTVDRFV